MNKITYKSPASQQQVTKLVNIVMNATTAQKSLFAAQISMDNSYKVVDPSQTFLGYKAGITRETANRFIGQFENNGLIITQRIYTYGTLRYHINPIFHDLEVRRRLSAIAEFRECFSKPSIQWLMPRNKSFTNINNKIQCEYITLVNNNKQTPVAIMSSEVKRVYDLTSTYFDGSDYRGGSFVPSRKNKNKTHKREDSMFNFTPEQLKELDTYAPDAVARAAKRLNQVIAEGRAPKDPFTWCLAICRQYSPTEDQPHYNPNSSFFKKAQQPPIQSQPPKSKAYTHNPDEEREHQFKRRAAIRDKAKFMGATDIDYRSIGELQSFIAGNTLQPISAERKFKTDLARAQEPSFQVLADLMNNKPNMSKSAPVLNEFSRVPQSDDFRTQEPIQMDAETMEIDYSQYSEVFDNSMIGDIF